MIADIGTKALSPAIFKHLRDYLLEAATLPDFLEYIEPYAPELFIPVSSYVLGTKER